MRLPLYILARMNEDRCHGAALMMSLLLDYFSANPKDVFATEDLLIFLDDVGQKELPEGMLDMVKDASEGKL